MRAVVQGTQHIRVPFFFLAAAVDIRVNNPTVNVGIQQLNNNAVTSLENALSPRPGPQMRYPGSYRLWHHDGPRHIAISYKNEFYK